MTSSSLKIQNQKQDLNPIKNIYLKITLKISNIFLKDNYILWRIFVISNMYVPTCIRILIKSNNIKIEQHCNHI